MKPKLRFKEFTDDWEEKKLGDLIDIQMCKRILKAQTNTVKGIPFYKIGTLGKEADAFISKDLFLEYKKKYNYPKINEVMMTCSGTVGKTFIFDGKPSYYQDSNIVWLSNDEKIVLNKFLYFNLNNINWNFLTSSTITRIYANDIYSLLINIPSLPEQEKIGTFLSLVDQRIEKQERKVALLEEEKKGYMQQIFNQELRFKDEEGNNYPDWKEKKLGEIADIKAGKDLDKSKLVDVGYPVYGNALTNKGLMGYYDDYEIKNEAVTVTGRGDIGKAFYRKGKFNTVGRLISIVSEENSYFLTYAINKVKILNETTGVPQLTALQLKKYKIQLPSLSEQEKIANFLSLLDQRIEKEQEKLHLLKEEKKGLLQQMFV